MAARQVFDGGLDGVTIGGSTAALVSFYGVTPIAQRSGATQAAVSTSTIAAVSATVVNASASNGSATWGFASSTQANNVVTTVNDLQTRASNLTALTNELRAALVALGAIAGA